MTMGDEWYHWRGAERGGAGRGGSYNRLCLVEHDRDIGDVGERQVDQDEPGHHLGKEGEMSGREGGGGERVSD